MEVNTKLRQTIGVFTMKTSVFRREGIIPRLINFQTIDYNFD